MKRFTTTLLTLTFLALSGVAFGAPNFVDNNTSLPAAKTDRIPITNPTTQIGAADVNAIFGALTDVRTVLQRAPLNVKAFGAVGDGITTTDGAAIQAALTAAGAAVLSGDGYGVIVQVPKGIYLTTTPLLIPNGVGLQGIGTPSSIIRAAPGFNGAALLANQHQDGTQEFVFVSGLTLDGNQGNGALCSTAVLDLTSVFVNSFVRDVLVENGSNVGMHIGANNAAGPVLIENDWVVNNIGHNVLIEEMAGNTQAFNGVIAVNLTSEHQGANKSAIYLKGLGHAQGWQFHNVHIEMGGTAVSRTGITIDGVSYVTIDGVQLLTSNFSNITAGIFITSSAQNVGIQIGSVTNSNLITPVISDALHNTTVGAFNLPLFVTPDVTMRGGLRFTPYSAAGSQSLVAQDSSRTDRAWFDDTGALTGSSQTAAAGVNVRGDATNNRPIAYIPNVASGFSNIYWNEFPTGASGALQLKGSSNGPVYQIGTDSTLFVYQPATFQLGIKGQAARAAAPSTGTHVAGEIVLNADPVASGFIGWVCVTSGTPGTWKSWGAISP